MRLRLESLCIKNIPESNSTNHSHTLNSKAACLFPSLFLPLLDCQTKLLKQNEASASANVAALTIYFILLYFTLLFLSLYFPSSISRLLLSRSYKIPIIRLSSSFQSASFPTISTSAWFWNTSPGLAFCFFFFSLQTSPLDSSLLFSSIREPSPPSRLDGIRSSLHFRETRSSVFWSSLRQSTSIFYNAYLRRLPHAPWACSDYCSSTTSQGEAELGYCKSRHFSGFLTIPELTFYLQSAPFNFEKNPVNLPGVSDEQ